MKANKIIYIIVFVEIILQSIMVANAANGEPDITFRNHALDMPSYQVTQMAKEMDRVEEYSNIPEYNVSSIWSIPPVIFQTNDNVQPGNVLYIYGEGMMQKDMKIALKITDKNIPDMKPPSDAFMLTPIQTDNDIKYVAAIIPKDMPKGVYDIWVSNKYGWSAPTRVNGAKPEWLRDDETAQGMTAAINGKNLDAAELGIPSNTKVALRGIEKTWEVPVVATNPFRVEFFIPENLPQGEYEVYVSNNGGISWVKKSMDDTLKVFEKTNDPYQLNVGWARLFKWDKKYSVKDYGAMGDGITDDTDAIVAAINDTKEKGGGMVFLPEGNYKITKTIPLYADIVIMGEGKDKSIVTYAYNGADAKSKVVMRSSGDGATEGRHGLLNFTLTLDKSVVTDKPDSFIALGNQWGAHKVAGGKTAEYIFAKGFSLSYDIINPYEGRALGILLMGKEHYLFAECDFKGNSASMVHSYVGKYTIVRNTDFHTARYNLGIVGIYQTYENLFIQRYPSLDTKNVIAQGIFMRGPSFAYNNTILDLGHKGTLGTDGDNDGEIICSEVAGGGTKFVGMTEKASEYTVTVDFKWLADPDFTNPIWGHYTIVVVDGRGMGQYANVSNYDAENKTFTLDRRWKVLPDKTSKLVCMVNSESCVMYKNKAARAKKGFWLFGDTINCVIKDNHGEEVEGAYIHAVYIPYNKANNSVRFNIGYYNRLDGNSFVGGAKVTGRCGVGYQVACQGSPESGVIVYGADIKNNSIDKAIGVASVGGTSEAPKVGGLWLVHNISEDAQKPHTLAKGNMAENNIVSNSAVGMNVGGWAYPYNDAWVKYSALNLTTGIILHNNDLSQNNKIMYQENGVNKVLFVK